MSDVKAVVMVRGQERVIEFESVHAAVRNVIIRVHNDECGPVRIVKGDQICFDRDQIWRAVFSFEGAHMSPWQRRPEAMREWQQIAEKAKSFDRS